MNPISTTTSRAPQGASKTAAIGVALLLALSAPLAFAQDATDASGGTAASPQAATAAGDADKKSWNDVDTNGDSALSQAEAASVPALAQVFSQADTDGDGALTADEYKAYVAKVQGGATDAQPAGE